MGHEKLWTSKVFLEFHCGQIPHDDLMKELPLKVKWELLDTKSQEDTKQKLIEVIKNYSEEDSDGNVKSL